MLVALGPIGFCLALMAFMPSLWTTALLVFAFFFAYYVYEPPYRGLYPDPAGADLRPCPERAAPDARGRAGNGADRRRCALPRLGAVPFLVAAVVVVAACAAPVLFVREDGGRPSSRACAPTSSTAGRSSTAIGRAAS